MSSPSSPRGPSPAPPDQDQLDDLHKKYQAANAKFGTKGKDFYAALNDPEVDISRLTSAFEAVKAAFRNKEDACSIFMHAAQGIDSQEHRLKACEKTLKAHVDKMKAMAEEYASRQELLEGELDQINTKLNHGIHRWHAQIIGNNCRTDGRRTRLYVRQSKGHSWQKESLQPSKDRRQRCNIGKRVPQGLRV